MFQVATLQERIKTLEDDNNLLTHSLSDKNAQIKLHRNQMSVHRNLKKNFFASFYILLCTGSRKKVQSVGDS